MGEDRTLKDERQDRGEDREHEGGRKEKQGQLTRLETKDKG